MNLQPLFSKFSQGINWNALLYLIYKVLSTSLTFILFKYLSTQDFSAWTNINSIIFLLLLWLDFGFRKSIPRYIPEFAQDKTSHTRFIKCLIYFQIAVLVLMVPLFFWTLSTATRLLQLEHHRWFFYYGSAIFFLEGIIAVVRLIYHAHFWIKQFNSIVTIAMLAEMTANMFIVVYYISTSAIIVQGIFVTKIISGIFITLISIIKLVGLCKDRNYIEKKEINFLLTINAFIKHSLIMWVNNTLKSLSERNFLVPLFTYTIGASAANIFKIANEGALFFYRTVLKTIGTTDTALLSHVQAEQGSKSLLPIAFKKLCSKIASLCFPVLGILCVIYIKQDLFFNNPYVFQTFFIMSVGYIIEFIISPYERVLEVKRRYVFLMCAYIPYVLMLALLIPYSASIGLLTSICIIHGVRLVSSLIMLLLTRMSYPLLWYPLRYALYVICLSLVVSILLYLLLTFYPLIFERTVKSYLM